jgi:hypothetical protein
MNSDELPIQAIIESRLRPVRPRGQLPKYGADSALSSLAKRQITGDVRVFLRWLGYWAWHRTAESRQIDLLMDHARQTIRGKMNPHA